MSHKQKSQFYFSNEYYKNLIHQHGYNPFDFNKIDFTIGNYSESEMYLRFLCHHNGKKFSKIPKRKRIITTGFGMSGVPHIGSISHIINMINLQKGGENCQIVLGDFDSYNGRSVPIEKSKELADKFYSFICDLGFSTKKGILRKQSDSQKELQNMYLVARYSKETSMEKYEEDVLGHYIKKKMITREMDYGRRLSLLLMISDFITIGQSFDAVLTCLGIDEHTYVRYATTIKDRLDDQSSLRKDFYLGSLYTTVTKGFNGFQKMSKSFEESGICVTDNNDIIKERILNESDPQSYENSLIFHLMRKLSIINSENMNYYIESYRKGNAEWKKRKIEVVEKMLDIKKKWPK